MPSRVAVDGRDVACGGLEGDVRCGTAQFAGDFQKRVRIHPHSSSFGIPTGWDLEPGASLVGASLAGAVGSRAYLWVRGLESHGDRLPRFSRRVRSPGVVRWILARANPKPKPKPDSRRGANRSIRGRASLWANHAWLARFYSRAKKNEATQCPQSSRRPVEPEPRAPGTHGSARPLISRVRVDALASRRTRGPHRRARTRP